MSTMTRAQHVEWCKQRALAELDDDADGKAPVRALTQLSRDLGRHPETRSGGFGGGADSAGTDLRSTAGMRRFIEGLR